MDERVGLGVLTKMELGGSRRVASRAVVRWSDGVGCGVGGCLSGKSWLVF